MIHQYITRRPNAAAPAFLASIDPVSKDAICCALLFLARSLAAFGNPWLQSPQICSIHWEDPPFACLLSHIRNQAQPPPLLLDTHCRLSLVIGSPVWLSPCLPHLCSALQPLSGRSHSRYAATEGEKKKTRGGSPKTPSARAKPRGCPRAPKTLRAPTRLIPGRTQLELRPY